MSLGMNFARRRMMAAAKKEEKTKYVWWVYEYGYIPEESTATTTQIRLSGTIKKMVSNSFRYHGWEGFELINPASTEISSLKVDQFVVSVTSSSNADKWGDFLYKVVSVTGSSTVTVLATRYSSAVLGKTGSMLYQVESDTLDYPVDGERDGLWYVLVSGEV